MFSRMADAASPLSLMPCLPKVSKKPGPTCKPIMKTNRMSPKSCTKVRIGVGAVNPMCPATIPANSTKVTPSDTPPILIFPKYTPTAITTAYSSAMCATESVVVNNSLNQ